MHTVATTSRLAVFLFSDLVGSTELKSKLGTVTYARLLERHDEIFKRLIAEYPDAEILKDTGDGYFAAFVTISDAVRFAIRFQQAMHYEQWDPRRIETRIGIHVGEVAHAGMEESGRPKLVGMAADLAARVMSLAQGGQILMTRTAFNEARQFIGESVGDDDGRPPAPLRWVAHGNYKFKGHDEPVEVYEVGAAGIAPLSPPPNNEKANRSVTVEQEETLGWRPAIGLEVPAGPGWLLQKKLGEGNFGEVWLAKNEATKELRVFKFCFDVDRLRSFKRELTLIRLLRDSLGERKDITKLHHVQLKAPPYYLESEYATGGNLGDWAESRGGLEKIPLDMRLDIVANIAEAVAAAHSVGVLHKDIKPSNILMNVERDGSVTPRLGDFGIGLLNDPEALKKAQITQSGFTVEADDEKYSRTGTPMYLPPELFATHPRPFSMQGDIYALGVLLYQMAVADLGKPLASGWEREVGDELLREDIAACVEGNPDLRLSSAAELARRLRTRPQRRAERQAARQAEARHAWRVRMAMLSAVIVIACVFVAILAVLGYYNARAASEAQTISADEARASEQRARLAELDKLAATGFSEIRGTDYAEATNQFEEAWKLAEELKVSKLRAMAGLLEARARGPYPLINRRADTLPDSSQPPPMPRLRVSPDGRFIVAGNTNQQAFVFEMPHGRRVATIPLGGWGYAIGFARKGKVLLIGSPNGNIRRGEVMSFDVGHWDKPRETAQGSVFIFTLAVAPDGESFVTTTDRPGKSVHLWSVSPLRLTRSLAPPSPAQGVAYSPDGRSIATGMRSGEILLWDLASGTVTKNFVGHAKQVQSVAFTPDGRTLVSGSDDQTIRVWDVATGATRHRRKFHVGPVREVAVSPDGKTGASASSDQVIRTWDIASGDELYTFSRHPQGATSVDFFADGSGIVSAGDNGRVAVWDIAPNDAPNYPLHSEPVKGLSLCADGLTALSAGDQTVKQFDLATGKVLREIRTPHRPTAMALAPGGRLALVGGEQAMLQVLDLATFTLAPLVIRESGEVQPIAPPPPTSRPQATGNAITSIALGGTPTRAAIGRADGTVRLVDFPSGGGVVARRSQDPIVAIALSGDGRRAFVAAHRWLHALDATNGNREHTFGETPRLLTGAALSADGKTAVTCAYENVVRPWDLADPAARRTLTGHQAKVMAVAFTPDGRTVLSCSEDSTLRLWDVESKKEMCSFATERDSAGVIAISADAMIILAGFADGSVRKWDLARSGQYRKFSQPLGQTDDLLDENPDNAAALAVMGEWYAFRGRDAWAVELLEKARARNVEISPLMMARCYWKLNRLEDAEREFNKELQRDPAAADYINLCLKALRR